MNFIAVFCIISAFVVCIWMLKRYNYQKSIALSLFVSLLLTGYIILLRDRITEVSINCIGSIKTTLAEVKKDADSVSNLMTRVENQSATVDAVASLANNAKTLAESVSNKNVQAQEKLKTLDAAILKANNVLTNLESMTDFTITVIFAQNDDRRAFDKLSLLAYDQSNPLHERALAAWLTIYDNHNNASELSVCPVTPLVAGIDSSELTIHDLSKLYAVIASRFKLGFLVYIWERNDLPLIDRLDFLISVIETDDSLKAVEYAGRYFTKATKTNFKPLATLALIQWWKDNRATFKEKNK